MEVATRTSPASPRLRCLRRSGNTTSYSTPGRYVGTEEAEIDDEPVEEKIERLAKELYAEFDRGSELEKAFRNGLRELGYGV